MADKSLYLYISIGDKLNIGNSYNLIGTIYYFKREYKKSLVNLNRAYELLQTNENKKTREDVLGNIGNIYKDTGEYDKALENYLRSLEIAKELSHIKGIFLANQNIGELYYIQEKYENALEYYLKAQEINEEYNLLSEHDREKFGLRINVIKKKLRYYEDSDINITYGEEEKSGEL